MKKLASIIVAITFLGTFTNLNVASAADFSSAPANIVSFENQINQSLLEMTCGGVKSVGFSGTYTISQEMKDKGQNTLALTSAAGTQSCRYASSSVPFNYLGKTYSGSISYWNGTDPDFASFSTSVNIPQIPLFGYDKPASGWWVDVVQNIQGFGLVWKQSKVELYNDNTLKFTIDAITPGVTDNALVFNNQGVFIGIVSSSQSMPIAGQVIVQGAPLQCGLNKQSLYRPTNCGKNAIDIWVPGVQAPSTPSPAAGSITQEYLDMVNAFNSQTSTVVKQLQNCRDVGNQEDTDVRVLLTSTTWWGQCATFTQRVTSLVNTSTANVKAVTTARTSSATDLQMQRGFLNQMNDIGDSVTALTSDMEGTLDSFISAIDLKKHFGSNLDNSLTQFDNDKGALASLPASLKTSILKLPSYKYLLSSQKSVRSSYAEFTSLLDGFSSVSSASDVERIVSGMQDIADQKALTVFVKNAGQLHSLVPTTYCKSGKKFALTTKAGTCLKGWTLVSL